MIIGDAAHAAQGADVLPNLRHLRLLDVAAREGSLTLAAQEVHVSQPAASQAMSKLSEIFGARLVERVGNYITLTPEGEVVIIRVRRALEHLRVAGMTLRSRKSVDRRNAADLLIRYSSMSQIRAIAAYATTDSFAATARKLGQAESSVQRACRDLERLVGTPLFEGGQRKRIMTPAGLRLAEQASLALKELSLAQAELRERAGLFDSRLVIGALPLSRTRLLPQVISRLMARHPRVHVEIMDGSYDALVQNLRLGTCDIILGALRGADCPAGLQEQPLFTDTLHVVARSGHPLEGKRLSGEDLARFPWIVPRSDAPARRVFERLAAQHGLSDSRRGHVETGSMVLLRGLLLSSDAVTLISLNQIDYEYTQGLLVPLDFTVDGTERMIGITSLASQMPSRIIQEIIDFIYEESKCLMSADNGIAEKL